MLIEDGMEDLRHASSGEITRGLFGEEVRALARRSKDVNQNRRLLSLAAVRDGMDRGGAAKIGGMDCQTLGDWVDRFNGSGPEGLFDSWTEGPKPRLSAEQMAEPIEGITIERYEIAYGEKPPTCTSPSLRTCP